jgi:hypothetical protein
MGYEESSDPGRDVALIVGWNVPFTMRQFRSDPSLSDMKLMCDVLYDAMSFTEPEVVAFPEVGTVLRIRVFPKVYGLLIYGGGHWYAKELLVNTATGDLEDYQPFGSPIPVTSQGADPVTAAKEIGGYVMERLRRTLEDANSSEEDRAHAAGAFTQLANRMEQGPPRY